MVGILVLVLILKIGIHAALDNRDNSNPLIPLRFTKSGQTRRFLDDDSSDLSSDEQSDSDYSSLEDYSLRSLRSLKSRLVQRLEKNLRYGSQPEIEAGLELAPAGKIVSINFAHDLLPSSTSQRRINPNSRRPYLRHRPSNVGTEENDDSSLEIVSLESSSDEDLTRLEEETSRLQLLLSLIDQSHNRRNQNRKYYKKGSNLSIDASPIDKLEPDEDAFNSLQILPQRKHQYSKEYNSYLYDLRFHEPSPTKDILDDYIDTILLVTDDDKPDEIPIGRPKIGSSELTDFNKLYDKRHSDDLYHDDVANNLSLLRRLKPHLRSSLPDSDNSRPITVLRLSNLEDLKLESPLLKSRDQKKHNNRKGNHRNFLRLSLSPDNKITLDEGVASDLSKLLSSPSHEFNLVPVHLRRTGLSNNKGKRKDKRLRGEDILSNFSGLRSEGEKIPKPKSSLRRHHKITNRNRKNNLRSLKNNKKALKNLFYNYTDNYLVPYQKVKSKIHRDNGRLINQSKNKIDSNFPDEFSLDTLFDFKKEDYVKKLDLDNNALSASSVPANQENLNLEEPPLETSYEHQSSEKDSTDTLHLEFPWNDQLSPNENESSTPQSQSSSREQTDNGTKDSTDVLHLEFPWNDQLSPNENKISDPQTQLRSREKIDAKNGSTDILHLEFPWIDQLSPDDDKNSNQSVLRELNKDHKQKDETNNTTDDTLRREFPNNDPTSSNEKKIDPLRSQSLRTQTDSLQDKEAKDELNLEFPWNDMTSPNKPSNKKMTEHTPNVQTPNLRNRNTHRHPNYFSRSYDEFTKGARLRNLKNRPFESNRRVDDDQRLSVLSIARDRPENGTITFRDSDEDMSDFVALPMDRRPPRFRSQAEGTPPLMTTINGPIYTNPLFNQVGDKTVKKSFNNTIIFPNN